MLKFSIVGIFISLGLLFEGQGGTIVFVFAFMADLPWAEQWDIVGKEAFIFNRR